MDFAETSANRPGQGWIQSGCRRPAAAERSAACRQSGSSTRESRGEKRNKDRPICASCSEAPNRRTSATSSYIGSRDSSATLATASASAASPARGAPGARTFTTKTHTSPVSSTTTSKPSVAVEPVAVAPLTPSLPEWKGKLVEAERRRRAAILRMALRTPFQPVCSSSGGVTVHKTQSFSAITGMAAKLQAQRSAGRLLRPSRAETEPSKAGTPNDRWGVCDGRRSACDG